MTDDNGLGKEVWVNQDGQRVRANAYSDACEEDVKRAIEPKWDCELHWFPRMFAIDFFAERKGRLVGLIEVKGRVYGVGDHPFVWLNVRKWLALNMAQAGLGVRAIFAVRFADEIRYLPVNEIDGTRLRIGGQIHNAKYRSDREPLIEVPVKQMRRVTRRRES